MSSAARSTVGLFDLAKRLPAMAPDVLGMALGAKDLLLSGPDSTNSVGLHFQRAAHKHPDRPFLRFEGRSIGYGEANAIVNRYASVLSARGVERGGVVGIMMKNRPETLFVILAAVKLGAAAGLLNHNQRGEVLAHSLGLLDATVLVVGAECVDGLATLTDQPDSLPAEELEREAADADDADPAVCREITGRETAFLIFTSGTTGYPKASVMSHMRWSKGMVGLGSLGVRLRGDDTLYCCLPLYHNNAVTVALSAVLGAKATLALGAKFSASNFWSDAALNKSTAIIYIGELCRYLLAQPRRSDDASHNIRLAVGNGLRPEIWDEFKTRFAIGRIVEFYGASEAPIAFVNALNVDRTAGVSPLPHAVVAYDEDTGQAKRGPNGRVERVGRGEVGLLLAKVTARQPFDGYTDPDATERKLVRNAFADGDCWFDTGDLVRRQGWMHIAFVDRLGDTFRWKGENVATTEVEGAVGRLPQVEQAVVYGVDVPGTDGKAGMAAVILNGEFDGDAAAQALYESLPAYAVPLFIRVVTEFEQTSTHKIQKVALRKEGYETTDPVYVYAGRGKGYVPFYEDYPADVAGGRAG